MGGDDIKEKLLFFTIKSRIICARYLKKLELAFEYIKDFHSKLEFFHLNGTSLRKVAKANRHKSMKLLLGKY